MLIKKGYFILAFMLIYFSFSLFLYNTSDNYWAKQTNNFFNGVFADIFFDQQDPNTWYNSNNPNASVTTTPNTIPVIIKVNSRYSH